MTVGCKERPLTEERLHKNNVVRGEKYDEEVYVLASVGCLHTVDNKLAYCSHNSWHWGTIIKCLRGITSNTVL
jgi:hypothetical protein